MRSKANSVKLIEVEYGGGVVRLVGDAIVFVAYSQVNGQRRINLPLILKIRHVEGAPQLMATPGRKVSQRAELRSDHGVVIAGKHKAVVVGLALIEAYSADFHSHLKSVASVRVREVI